MLPKAMSLSLEQQLLEAIRGGNTTREKLMAIDSIRHQTWGNVGPALAALVSRRLLVKTKAGWRLADGRETQGAIGA